LETAKSFRRIGKRGSQLQAQEIPMKKHGERVTRLSGFLFGLALACWMSPATTVAQEDKSKTAADAPPSLSKEELTKAEARLAELNQVIPEKEKELAALKTEAERQRKLIATAKEAGKVVRSVAELLADMPKDVYPVYGPNGSIERAAARKWLQEKLGHGKNYVEWEATVKDVVDQGQDPFFVSLVIDATLVNSGSESGGILTTWPLSEPVLLGDQNCQVMLSNLLDRKLSTGPVVSFSHCAAEEVRLLRALKGKKVTFRAAVQRIDVIDNRFFHGNETGKAVKKQIDIILSLSEISVNGFLPASSTVKQKLTTRERFEPR
jgi:hypothetical protein